MRIALFGRKINKQSTEYFQQVIDVIESFGWSVVIENELKSQLVTKYGFDKKLESFSDYHDFSSGIDLMISLGGDGTFLQSVGFIRNSGVPIIGINTGRLGFYLTYQKKILFPL